MELFEITPMALIHNEGNLLILKFAKGSTKWSIPGGHMERGEILEEALYREIKEETGIAPENLKILRLHSTETFKREQNSVFILTYELEADTNKVALSDEHTQYSWVGPDEVDEYEYAHPQVKRLIVEALNDYCSGH